MRTTEGKGKERGQRTAWVREGRIDYERQGRRGGEEGDR